MKTKLPHIWLTKIILAILFITPVVKAITPDASDSYKLQWTNLNTIPESSSSANFNLLHSTPKETLSNHPSSTQYLKAGFPYLKTITPFAFTISGLSIDFQDLIPGVFQTQTNTLTISSAGVGGYSVTAFEDHPLQLQSATASIPDTTCDTACDQSIAKTWTSINQYGFGYNLKGDDVPSDFTNSTFFKQFADYSLTEPPQIIMSSNLSNQNRTATVTYKLNLSPTQASGNYQNMVTFTAIPGY